MIADHHLMYKSSTKQVKTKVKRVIKRKRNSYSVEQKTNVVIYAKKSGNIRAAKHFNIDINETNGKKRRLGSGRKP
ncbi:17554_t:CDS:2, partial [Funneliformis geosporum]